MRRCSSSAMHYRLAGWSEARGDCEIMKRDNSGSHHNAGSKF